MEVTRPTIAELEAYFASAKLPASFSINPGESVSNIPDFVAKQIRIIKADPGSKATAPAMDRLLKLKAYIEQQ